MVVDHDEAAGVGQGAGLGSVRAALDALRGLGRSENGGSERLHGMFGHSVRALSHVAADVDELVELTGPAGIEVAVVHGQVLVREGIARVVEAQADMRVVEAAATLDEVRWAGSPNARQVLVIGGAGLAERDDPSGEGVLTPSASRLVVLADSSGDDEVARWLSVGASGVLFGDSRTDEVVGAVRAAARDMVLAPRKVMQRFSAHYARSGRSSRNLAMLTKRENDVFALVVDGLSNPEIRSELCLAESTVKAHVGRILGKLGLRDRAQLIVWAHRALLPESVLSERDSA